MVILVGALFDDIYIRRLDSSGNETELIEVPITYSSKDKMLARVMQDPGIANLTWSDGASATLTIGNGSINTAVNSSVFVNGNTYINATTLSVGNGGTVLVGNAT
jgi:T4-like virus Myoviridae tail sheath stabiliser